MKTKQQIFDMLDRFMETMPQPSRVQAEIDATITALDWVLGRVDTEEFIDGLPGPAQHIGF